MSFLMKFVQGGQSASAAKSASRSVARDRLSVILASQRGSELLEGVCMEDLQRDVLQVVERHIQIAKNRPVQFNVNSENDTCLFEMSVELAASRRQNLGKKGPIPPSE